MESQPGSWPLNVSEGGLEVPLSPSLHVSRCGASLPAVRYLARYPKTRLTCCISPSLEDVDLHAHPRGLPKSQGARRCRPRLNDPPTTKRFDQSKAVKLVGDYSNRDRMRRQLRDLRECQKWSQVPAHAIAIPARRKPGEEQTRLKPDLVAEFGVDYRNGMTMSQLVQVRNSPDRLGLVCDPGLEVSTESPNRPCHVCPER